MAVNTERKDAKVFIGFDLTILISFSYYLCVTFAIFASLRFNFGTFRIVRRPSDKLPETSDLILTEDVMWCQLV